jgi:tight adherence protein B
MGPALVTFVLWMVIVLGGYWMFVVRPEDVAARRLRRRLQPPAPERQHVPDLKKKEQPLSALKMLDTLLVRSGSVIQPVRRVVELSALPTTVGIVLMACALAGTVACAVVLLTTDVGWLAVLAGMAVAPLPYLYVRVKATKRLRAIEEQFPQAVDLITVSLRAGHAFTTGLMMVAEEISNPLGAEFRLMYDQQNYGKPVPDVLREFAERVPLLDVRIFATAVLTQRETGGNLAEVLDKLAALIRERFTIRRQVRAVSAHGRITGWVLTLLPAVVAGILAVVAPEHMAVMVTDPIGLQLIAAAMLMQIIGAIVIRRIVNIEI